MKCCSGSMDLNFSSSPCGHRGKPLLQLLVFFVLLVLAFLVHFQEALELRDASGGAEEVVGAVLARGRNIDGGLIEHGGHHLRSDKPHPDQPVQLQLVFLQKGRDDRPASAAPRWAGWLRGRPERPSCSYRRWASRERTACRSGLAINARTSSRASFETRVESRTHVGDQAHRAFLPQAPRPHTAAAPASWSASR